MYIGYINFDKIVEIKQLVIQLNSKKITIKPSASTDRLKVSFQHHDDIYDIQWIDIEFGLNAASSISTSFSGCCVQNNTENMVRMDNMIYMKLSRLINHDFVDILDNNQSSLNIIQNGNPIIFDIKSTYTSDLTTKTIHFTQHSSNPVKLKFETNIKTLFKYQVFSSDSSLIYDHVLPVANDQEFGLFENVDDIMVDIAENNHTFFHETEKIEFPCKFIVFKELISDSSFIPYIFFKKNDLVFNSNFSVNNGKVVDSSTNNDIVNSLKYDEKYVVIYIENYSDVKLYEYNVELGQFESCRMIFNHGSFNVYERITSLGSAIASRCSAIFNISTKLYDDSIKFNTTITVFNNDDYQIFDNSFNNESDVFSFSFPLSKTNTLVETRYEPFYKSIQQLPANSVDSDFITPFHHKSTLVYKDLDLSFNADFVYNTESIKQSLMNLFFASSFDRPFRSYLDSRLSTAIFSVEGSLLEYLLSQYVENILTQFEPRVRLYSVDVSKQSNTLKVNLTFSYMTDKIDIQLDV
jgi:phage baseplate assembly protein W